MMRLSVLCGCLAASTQAVSRDNSASCPDCTWLKTKPGGALFARNFDLECLSAVDGTAIEDAYTFFTDNVRELRWETNCLGAGYLVALVWSMQQSEIPDPRRSNGGKVMFCVWAVLQMVLFLSQSLGLFFVLLAYASMKEHFGHCLLRWQGDGMAFLDLTSLMCTVWLPSVLQKLLAIKVIFLTTCNGLRALQFDRMGNFMERMQARWDLLVGGAGVLSLTLVSAWTAVSCLGIPLLPILILMAIGQMVLVVGLDFLLSGKDSCCRWWKHGGTAAAPQNVAHTHLWETFHQVLNSWPRRKLRAGQMGPRLPEEATAWTLVVHLATLHWRVGRGIAKMYLRGVAGFTQVSLSALIVAPWLLSSTWWASYIYDRRFGSSEDGAVLGEIYEFSCLSAFHEGITFPAILDLTEMGALLDPATLLETLLELGGELALPHILLQRSRTWSLLSTAVGVIKFSISLLEKLLDAGLCPCGVPWETARVMDGASAEAMRIRGCTAEQVAEGGHGAEELLAAGFSVLEIWATGFGVEQLEAAGVSIQDLLGNGV